MCLLFSGCVCVKFVRGWGAKGIYISTWHSQNTYISFHLIFSDFLFILYGGVLAGDSGDSHPGLYFPFREIKYCDICDQCGENCPYKIFSTK